MGLWTGSDLIWVESRLFPVGSRTELMVTPTTAVETPSCLLRLATLNITDARNARLNTAIRCMKEMKVDIAVLTETKLHHDRYTKSSDGYTVVATVAEKHKGGVAIVYRKSPGWTLESIHSFGKNVIRATLVSGQKRYSIVGAYIPPSEEDGATLASITEACSESTTRHWPLILLGDFNVDLHNLGGILRFGASRRMETATLVESLGLKSMREHFRQRERYVGKYWTWTQRRRDVIVGAICDHIFSTSREIFTNCQLKRPRFDTDHCMLVSSVKIASVAHHRRYAKARSTFPLGTLPAACSEVDTTHNTLAACRQKKGKTTGRNSSWISEDTWILIDRKVNAREIGNWHLAKELKREIRQSLNSDRKQRTVRVADTIASHLAEWETRDAFQALKGWYKSWGPRPVLPSREDIEATRVEYQTLFESRSPDDPPLPLHIPHFHINDGSPSEEEVVFVLKSLKNGKAAGPSGLRVEDLKQWYFAAREPPPETDPDPVAVDRWEKVLDIVNVAFSTGEIPKALCWGILVLIPKSTPGQFRGIALLEVIYKLISSLCNKRMQAAITFDDALHGFVKGRGTGTAIMEAKLLMQLHCREDSPLHMVFIDLKKAYDTLDRDAATRILKAYGVGPNILRILLGVWAGDTMVPRQAGYFGKKFQANRGVRQGDIISPLIFNVMVDAVVRYWRNCMGDTLVKALFYADDGLLSGTDPIALQESINIITKGFSSIGLKMNAAKTEYMQTASKSHRGRVCTAAYKYRWTGEGGDHRTRALQKVQCINCGAIVAKQTLTRHQKSQKCARDGAKYVPPTPVRERVANEAVGDLTPRMDPCQFTVSVPRGHQEEVPCPVPTCVYKVLANRGSKRSTLRRHFVMRHPEDTIIVSEEGLLPRCQSCGLFAKSVNSVKHQNSLDCHNLTERRRRYFAQYQQNEPITFYVGNVTIKRVYSFKYLGRILEHSDNDNLAAENQLRKARARWSRVGRVLSSEKADPKVMGYFYKAIVQAVLLYGSESWTLSEGMLRRIRSFHSRVARFLCNRHIRCNEDGTWEYPHTEEVLESAGLFSIDEYIRRRRASVYKFMSGREILVSCRNSILKDTNVSRLVWWKLPIVSEECELPSLSSGSF